MDIARRDTINSHMAAWDYFYGCSTVNYEDGRKMALLSLNSSFFIYNCDALFIHHIILSYQLIGKGGRNRDVGECWIYM